MNGELRVRVLALTKQGGMSEHINAGELQPALWDCGVQFVDDLIDADAVRIFKTNPFTRYASYTVRTPRQPRCPT